MKRLTAVLFYLVLTLYVAVTLSGLVALFIMHASNSDAIAHNKKSYEVGETLVWKNNGDLVVVSGREYQRTYGRGRSSRLMYTVVRDANDPTANKYTVHPEQLEKLQLKKPSFEQSSAVKHKKTGLTGIVRARYQGFDKWIYKVYLDKDFENYEEALIPATADPRKYQEWNEEDVLPACRVPCEAPRPEPVV